MTQPSASKPDVHRTTVDRLVADAFPVARLWPVRRRLTLWVALSGAILAVASLGGFRTDLTRRITDPAYVGNAMLLLLAAIVTAGLAFRAAEPGREARLRESLGASVLVAAAILLALATPANSAFTPALLERNVARCIMTAVTLAAAPWLALLLALERGAPVRATIAGAQAGAAAFLVAAFQLRLLCPLDDRLHLLALHLGPIGLASLISSLLCTAWFRWRAAAHGRRVLRR